MSSTIVGAAGGGELLHHLRLPLCRMLGVFRAFRSGAAGAGRHRFGDALHHLEVLAGALDHLLGDLGRHPRHIGHVAHLVAKLVGALTQGVLGLPGAGLLCCPGAAFGFFVSHKFLPPLICIGVAWNKHTAAKKVVEGNLSEIPRVNGAGRYLSNGKYIHQRLKIRGTTINTAVEPTVRAKVVAPGELR